MGKRRLNTCPSCNGARRFKVSRMGTERKKDNDGNWIEVPKAYDDWQDCVTCDGSGMVVDFDG